MLFSKKLTAFLFENHGVGQTVTKNTFWLFMGQITSRLFRAAIVIYAARALGASGWGAFSYALGIATLLTIITDIGLNALITRQGARDPRLRSQYLSTAFFIKLALIAIATVILIAMSSSITNIPEAHALIPILIFVFAFDTIRDLGNALIRSLEHMELEAALTVATNAAIALLGFIFLAVNRTSASLAFAYAAGSGVGLAIAAASLRKHVGNLFKSFNRSLIIPIFKTAWPFGLIGIMGIVMLNTDIVMLGWFRSASEVGYYSAAQKFVQLLYVLPALLAVSIFPTITRLVGEHKSIRSIVSRSLTAVFAVAVPLAALGIVLAAIVIPFFFGDAYGPAITPFRILMLSLIFVYPSSILSHVVFAYGAERRILGIVWWTIFGNAFFNLLLIPSYGIIGASIATIIVQSVTNLMFWNIVYRISGMSILTCFSRRSRR